MKITFLQNIEGVAGSEKYFLALIPELIKKGLEVDMYCVVKKDKKEQAMKFTKLLEDYKIPFTVLYTNNYSSLKIIKSINKHIKTNKTNILHAHLIYADFWGAMIKKFLNKNFIFISTKHGYHEETYVKYCNQPNQIPKNTYYRLFKFSEKYTDKSYACSYGLKEFYEKAGLIQKDKMDVIQHGFNYPFIESFDENQYRFSNTQIIIVGRLIERKGHHFVFEILPEIIQEFPDLKLIILGDGPLEEKLKEMTVHFKLDKNVTFLGFKKEVEKYLSASDLAVFPSYSEGLPLVIFEAFNAKVPVVSFNSIGCNELVIHEETGLIAKAFDKNELKTQILRMLKDENLKNKCIENAYLKLNQHFSLQRMVDDTIQYYKILYR